MQAGSPSLGAFLDHFDLIGCHVNAHNINEKVTNLIEREA